MSTAWSTNSGRIECICALLIDFIADKRYVVETVPPKCTELFDFQRNSKINTRIDDVGHQIKQTINPIITK